MGERESMKKSGDALPVPILCVKMTEQLQVGQIDTPPPALFCQPLRLVFVYISQANRRQPPEIHTRQMVLEAG